MPSYRYIKAPPGYTLPPPPSLIRNLRRVVSAFLLTLGVAAFTSVIYPLLIYNFTYAERFARPLSPRPATSLVTLSPPVSPARAAEPTFLPEMINTTFDYTDAQIWFPQAHTTSLATPAIYTLSIPSLGIDRAMVKNDHTDLKNSLIHYPGTAMPGELGNPVVFGHSVLPQFFNPKNYISIFSTLHTLEPGDLIEITSDNATYTYHVTSLYEVMPDDLSPLAQTFDARRLTLITCTPPGTYLRRLIVKAQL